MRRGVPDTVPIGQWVDGRGQRLPARSPRSSATAGAPPACYSGTGAFVLGKSHPAVRTHDEGLIAKGL